MVRCLPRVLNGSVTRAAALAVAAAIAGPAAAAAAPPNLVAGSLIVLDDDGGWCWFQGERALHLGDRVLVGTVSAGVHDELRRGDINLVVHAPASGETEVVELHDRLERDDHDSPALQMLPDGRLLAVYARHGSDDLMRWRRTTRPGDVTEWEAERTLPGRTGGRGVTYANLSLLSSEGQVGTLYNMFRGAGWDPTTVISPDLGETWTQPATVVAGPGRPYMRYVSNGMDTIHFVCTEAHPRNADTGIRHGFVRYGRVHDSAGEVLTRLGDLPPASVDDLTEVRAGAPDAVAWCSDIRLSPSGHPVIVYSEQRDSAGLPPGRGGTDHRYRYARWDGTAWTDEAVAFAGTRLYAGEDDYTGLITLDPRDVSVVWFSTNAHPVTGAPLVSQADGQRHHEIWRGRRAGGSDAWGFSPVTRDSTVDNLRPIVAAAPDGRAMLIWMRGTYRSYQDFDTDVVGVHLDPDFQGAVGRLAPSGHPAPRTIDAPFDPRLEPAAIAEVAGSVAAWQMANESRHPKWDWTQGAYHVGLMHWAMTTRDDAIAGAMRERFAAMEWKLGPRPFMADDHCVGYAYQQLAVYGGDASPLGPTIAAMDAVLSRSQDEPLDWRNGIWDREWAWCDALFMGPPTLAHLTTITGDPRYLERADRLWWKTTDFLYNPEERLFWRDARFIGREEANGRAVHWSRGNGWVMGGLVRMLEILPESHPSRPRYLALYRDMAAALARLQMDNGSWTSSLLAPPAVPQPESSGTAFFCYALAWGLNQGVLDEATYGPVVEGAWRSLVAAVHRSGKLGWVQRAADAPGTAGPDETEVYAVGGFLLAAAEMWERATVAGAVAGPVDRTIIIPEAFEPALAARLDFDRSILPAATAGASILALDVRRGVFRPVRLEPGSGPGQDRLVVTLPAMPGERLVLRFFLVEAAGAGAADPRDP